MDIAAVSVVSSGVVALGTIVANFIGGERQRSHETDLDFEKRVWDRKSDALFQVIEECRTMLDSFGGVEMKDENRVWWALHLSRRRDALRDVRSTVEALASSECRGDLTAVIEAMDAQGVKEYLGRRVDRHREQMFADAPPEASAEQLLGRLDPQARFFERMQRYGEQIKETEARAVADFQPDLVELRERTERLLESARASVRRPKD